MLIERYLDLVRKISVDVNAQPLREICLQMGVDVQIVYFQIRWPAAGGVMLGVPVLIKPKFYSPRRGNISHEGHRIVQEARNQPPNP